MNFFPVIAVNSLATPKIVQPAAYAPLAAGSPVLINAKDNSLANTWRFYISKSVDFILSENGKECTNCVVNEKTSVPSYTATLDSGLYYVIVRAGHTDENKALPASQWSIPHPFYVKLATPQLSSPTGEIQTTKPILVWTKNAPQMDTFRVQVSSSRNFITDDTGKNCSNCVEEGKKDKTSATQYQITKDLAPGTYYWRVRVGRDADNPVIPHSEWSEVGQFTVVNSGIVDPSVCSKKERTQYSLKKKRLRIPYINLPTFNAITGEATGDFMTMSVDMQLKDNGFKVTKIKNRKKEVDPQCHATVVMPNIDIIFPFVEVPLYVELAGKERRAGSSIFSAEFSYNPDIERFTIKGNSLQYLGNQD
jgi:hypothetical protein